ncbi:MAG: hypothetical protein AAF330_06320 [Pseudomonadota bacterium]
MSVIRPEAATLIARWWGFGLALTGLALGLTWAVAAQGLLPYAGAVLSVVSALFAVDQLKRARFVTGDGGAGLVEVDERQITYFSAGQRGARFAIDSLARVEIEVLGARRRAWVFSDAAGGTLRVPLNAVGAEALFDALAALPGMHSDEAVKAASAKGPDRFLIWQRDRRRLH